MITSNGRKYANMLYGDAMKEAFDKMQKSLKCTSDVFSEDPFNIWMFDLFLGIADSAGFIGPSTIAFLNVKLANALLNNMSILAPKTDVSKQVDMILSYPENNKTIAYELGKPVMQLRNPGQPWETTPVCALLLTLSQLACAEECPELFGNLAVIPGLDEENENGK